MIDQIDSWIDSVNKQYLPQRRACSAFADEFKGYYKKSFLKKAYYVVVDVLPKPDFAELRGTGLSDFLDMNVDAITYKDTYYIKRHCENDHVLHFHELVHVAQWKTLKSHQFIRQYINEISSHGYDQAPLELMAYKCDRLFSNKESRFDVPKYVKRQLSL